MYESPVKDGKSRFEIWERGGNIGPSVTPSTFDKKYLNDIVSTIVEILKAIENPKILSLGCGNAFIESELNKLGYNILATDVSEQGLNLAKQKGVKTAFLDAVANYEVTDRYDLIMSDGVIGHLADDKASIDTFLDKSLRYIREGGFIFIANDTPTKDIEIQKHDGFQHIYWFSESFFKKSLERAGFKNIKSKYLEYFRPKYGTRKRILIWGQK